MSIAKLPAPFVEVAAAAITAIHRSYDINSERHDPQAGDDAVVFGIGVYRNSWFLIEKRVAELDHWTSARPEGSLVLTGAGLRVHVYRHGHDAHVDLDAFRLDRARASETQRLIAEANTLQLTFGFEPESAPAPAAPTKLTELVIVHAGNPDEGCCGVWVGAPIATEEITYSPWAWIEPLWLREDGTDAGGGNSQQRSLVPHDELPEPEIRLETVKEMRSGTK